MSFLTLRKLTHSFGAKPLIEEANLIVNKGDKLCLLGRNGMGKSTLLKIIAGEIDPDAGTVERDKGLRISMLQQAVPAAENKTVFDIVSSEDEGLEFFQVSKILSKLNLDAEKNFSELSGGLKRRVLLAKALVNDPDILLLDEPTNHLDIDSIQWLEGFLQQYSGTLILVSHDRQLLQVIGNHFVEIDQGKLISYRGDYQHFLKHKEYVQSAEAQAQEKFDKKLAEEEVWIRQGIKARRTRNEGRVRALEKLREEYKQRRSKLGKVKLIQQKHSLSGKDVFVVEKLNFSFENTSIVKDFSTIIQRGDKVGILGPNGVGKSTLIKLLLNQLEPQSGTVKHGTKLEVVYYDQHRQQLDEEKSIIDNVCEGSDYVEIGERKVHLMSYLQDFLFSPVRIRTPVKALSGGERNRIMLAKLFMNPSNVMILDEPTNDLDIETLEILEEQLLNYKGTMLLVSHDREFIDNIVTRTLVFEAKGHIQDYAGGYSDWVMQRKEQLSEKKQTQFKKTTLSNIPSKKKAKKLSFNEQRELAHLPKVIEKLESDIERLQHKLADPSLYKKGAEVIADAHSELAELQGQLEKAYNRWGDLES